jgi:hypothetical protein
MFSVNLLYAVTNKINKVKKTIIYLISQPLDKRNYERFGMVVFQNRGWDVKVWDLTPYIFPDIWKSEQLKSDSVIKSPAYQIVFSLSEFNKLVADTDANIYIDIIDNLESTYAKLLVPIHKKGAYRLLLHLGNIPLREESILSRRRIKVLLKQPRKILNFARIYLTGRKINRINNKYRSKLLIAVGGKDSYDKAYRQTLDVSQIIKAHNFDYDRFRSIKNISLKVDHSFFVFIDQDLIFHIDFLLHAETPSVTTEKYYPAIYKVLSTISTALNVSAKIAAHPRSGNRLLEEKYYGNISVVTGATAELIKESKFVVCHTSTASQLAILFKKPIVFLTTNEMKQRAIGLEIEHLAGLLGTKEVNVDSDLASIDWSRLVEINNERYDQYKYKYIKMPDSSETNCWDIIEKYLIRIL